MEDKTIRDSLEKVVYFDNDLLVAGVANKLSEGKQVIVEVELYRGNGKWNLDEHRYKMFVPVMDNSGVIYSTDVFKTIKAASQATYEIYRATRQNVTKLISYEIDADLSPERFGHGYTEEKYGRIFLTPSPEEPTSH